MTDKQRTCGDCVNFRYSTGLTKESGVCTANRWTEDRLTFSCSSAEQCRAFCSHPDQALIDECHLLRSRGAAVEWHKIDRLVEIAAGRELDREKRCKKCEGIGHSGVIALNENGNPVRWVDCEACQGTGYQKGGER